MGSIAMRCGVFGKAMKAASARSPTGSRAARTSINTAGADLTRASTKSPRTTVFNFERSGQLQRQAQRGQWRRQQTTATPTTIPGTAGWRGRSDDPEINEVASPAAAEFSGNSVSLSRACADALSRRRVGATERKQQRLLPGQRTELAFVGTHRRAERYPRVHEEIGFSFDAIIRFSGVQNFSRAHASAGSRDQGRDVVQSGAAIK